MANSNDTTSTLRFAARILGMLGGGFFLFMFVGESCGSWDTVLTASTADKMMFSGMGIYSVSMLLAVRWERVAVTIGTAGYLLHYVVLTARNGLNTRGGLNPFFLFLWVPILLYLICWWLEARAVSEPPAKTGVV